MALWEFLSYRFYFDTARRSASDVCRLRDRAPRIPWQALCIDLRFIHCDVSANRHHRTIIQYLANHWLVRYLVRVDYSLHDFYLATSHLDAFRIFREIPWDLDKAARVDGATPFQAFRYVIAPLASPAVFTTAILVFIFRLERLPVRDFAYLNQQCTHGARSHRILYRQLPFRSASRFDCCSIGCCHPTDHHRHLIISTTDRRRSYRWCGKRLRVL